MGHGHVTPNPDGSRARCGGPPMCDVCNKELEAVMKNKSDLENFNAGVEAIKAAVHDLRSEVMQKASGVYLDQTEYLLQFFVFSHLPQHLQVVSAPFADLAQTIAALPANPERDEAMRKLLESKDCAVRAKLAKPPTRDQ